MKKKKPQITLKSCGILFVCKCVSNFLCLCAFSICMQKKKTSGNADYPPKRQKSFISYQKRRRAFIASAGRGPTTAAGSFVPGINCPIEDISQILEDVRILSSVKGALTQEPEKM